MEHEKRNRIRGNDMSNFSRKNKLLTPPAPSSSSAIIGAVVVLCSIAQHFYRPTVYETFTAALNFLGELRVSELPATPEALVDLAAWVDDRLELFRVLIIEENWTEVDDIKKHFNASHESFVRVHQLILRRDVAAAVKAAHASSNRSNHQSRGERNSEADKRTPIPIEIREALPRQGSKQICLRFLSAQGCRGKNGSCVIKNLCHFKPAALPENVREFITKNYGGLSVDMQ
ncbi:hypothetical protein PR003_g14991 [Phytophthora rubi]|uniref:Uncharacterized protein n=1 Tax=Phytophthora rubi TaxID=129364 RepID=A0A6A4EXR4_9STRA|nr:hypothetical protein PR003_g14991 [Phytophthora rubi]